MMNDIELEIAELVEQVEEGNADAILAYKELSSIAKVLDQAKKQVSIIAVNEARSYGQKSFEHEGMKCELRSGRKVWDFKGIPEWAEMTKAIKDKTEQYKGAYSAWEKGGSVFDEETGEQIPIPKVKYTDDVLVIK